MRPSSHNDCTGCETNSRGRGQLLKKCVTMTLLPAAQIKSGSFWWLQTLNKNWSFWNVDYIFFYMYDWIKGWKYFERVIFSGQMHLIRVHELRLLVLMGCMWKLGYLFWHLTAVYMDFFFPKSPVVLPLLYLFSLHKTCQLEQRQSAYPCILLLFQKRAI